MPRRQTDIVQFPRARTNGLVLCDDDHAFLLRIIGPFHGREVEGFLTTAPAEPGGRRLSTSHPAMEQLLNAIGVEVHGFMKLEDEQAGRPRLKPKRGGTAEHLLALYRRIEDHLS